MAQIQLSTKVNLDTWSKLDELVKKTDKSKASLVDQAIIELHNRTFATQEKKSKKGAK